MKILVGADVPPNPDSGAAGTVYATNVALRRLGCDVDEIWSSDLAHRIRHWNLHYLLELPREYRTAVRKRFDSQAYDVVQLSQPHAWLAARENRRRRRRAVMVNRSHGLESLADEALDTWLPRLGTRPARFPRSIATPWLRRRLHRHIDLVARYADGMIVPSNEIRERLVQVHGAAQWKVRVIHHGVPESFLRRAQAPMDSERAHKMLHVAQFSVFKAPRLVAESACLVLAANPHATMTWVCGRNDHSAVEALFPVALRPRLRLLDWRGQDALIGLYDEHGIQLFHSLYEGAAKACTEAMARGQVLVSSAVGALKEHIRQGENGFLVPVGDVEGIATHALGVMRAPDAAARIGAAAASTAATLSWERCASESLDFYRFLASNPN